MSLSISALPKELCCHVLSLLPAEELTNIVQINHHFQEIISNPQLPFYLKKKKLTKHTASHNLQLLWRNPEGDFYVNQDEKLILISVYNIFRRLWKKWNNSNSEIDKKVQLVAKLTLEEAYRLAVDKNEYLLVSDKVDSLEVDFEDYSAPISTLSEPFLTVDFVACRLAHSNQFKNLDAFTFNLFKNDQFFGFIKNNDYCDCAEDYWDQ